VDPPFAASWSLATSDIPWSTTIATPTCTGTSLVLANNGYCYGFAIKVDSIYGTNTANAVRSAQQFEGATQDGIYGPETIGLGFHYQENAAPAGFTECAPIEGPGI
jgi:peptidoglycan hydrolase-like protein with peptidoglycan-binding domain